MRWRVQRRMNVMTNTRRDSNSPWHSAGGIHRAILIIDNWSRRPFLFEGSVSASLPSAIQRRSFVSSESNYANSMNDEQWKITAEQIVPRLKRALRESWNKSFQLFHAAARLPRTGSPRRSENWIFRSWSWDTPLIILSLPSCPVDRIPRKSISLSYRRREGESAARLANNSRIWWPRPITIERVADLRRCN